MGVRGEIVGVISLFPPVHPADPGDGTQVVRHGSNHLPTSVSKVLAVHIKLPIRRSPLLTLAPLSALVPFCSSILYVRL